MKPALPGGMRDLARIEGQRFRSDPGPAELMAIT